MGDLYNVAFEAEMDESDVGAMNDLFKLTMEQEMHIDCKNLKMEIQQ